MTCNHHDSITMVTTPNALTGRVGQECARFRLPSRASLPASLCTRWVTIRISQQSGVTLIEVMMLTFWVALGCAGAVWGGNSYGWVGGIGGFVGGLAVPGSLFLFLGYMEQMIVRGRPPFPVCRNGKCRYGNYQYQRVDGGGYALFCRCGGRYRKTGRRFMQEMPDGSLRPYMIWKAFRGWFPASQ